MVSLQRVAKVVPKTKITPARTREGPGGGSELNDQAVEAGQAAERPAANPEGLTAGHAYRRNSGQWADDKQVELNRGRNTRLEQSPPGPVTINAWPPFARTSCTP
jgi:hypothetical protein